jgi:hypothetical protein
VQKRESRTFFIYSYTNFISWGIITMDNLEVRIENNLDKKGEGAG